MSRNALNLNFNKLQYEDFTSCFFTFIMHCPQDGHRGGQVISMQVSPGVVHYYPRDGTTLQISQTG